MSIGEGLATDFERAKALVEEIGGDAPMTSGHPRAIDMEILVFIRRPELRQVAESALRCVPSFSRTSVLRKLLEADEALTRASMIDMAYHDRMDAMALEEESNA